MNQEVSFLLRWSFQDPRATRMLLLNLLFSWLSVFTPPAIPPMTALLAPGFLGALLRTSWVGPEGVSVL